MMVRVSQICVLAGLVAALGCQNPLISRREPFGDRDRLESRFSYAADNLAAPETGRGHSPSPASDAAGRRRENSGLTADGSASIVQQLLERGFDADAHGRTAEARKLYQHVLAEQPNHPEAHHRLAILADRAGDYSSAEKHYQIALGGEPNDADLYNDAGYSYFLQGRAEESQHYLTKALELDPQHPHVEENLSLLTDPAKAERVLISAMPPRQAQSALARLFPNNPSGHAVAARTAQLSDAAVKASRRTLDNSSRFTSSTLNALELKMEEARLRSLAERERQNTQTGLADQTANVPALPPSYPRQPPPQSLGASLAEAPKAEITDAFVAIDAAHRNQQSPLRSPGMTANRASQVPQVDNGSQNAAPPPAVINAEWNTLDHGPQPPEWNAGNPKAEAPQWNTLPQAWPQITPGVSASASSQSNIEQAGYTQEAPANRAKTASAASVQSAAQEAAEIGMAAGPGVMFPTWKEVTPDCPAQTNEAILPEPKSQTAPTEWNLPPQSSVPPQWNPGGDIQNFGQGG